MTIEKASVSRPNKIKAHIYNNTNYTDLEDKNFELEVGKKQLEKNETNVSNMEKEFQELESKLLKNENPCELFRLSNLPPVLRDYVSAKCKITDAHPIMLTLSVMATISAFLGKKVLLPNSEYFQDLFTNTWSLCVTESGLYKTTALNSGASLALQKQTEVLKEIKCLQAKLSQAANDEEKKEIQEKIFEKSLENIVLPQRITGEAFIKHLGEGHYGAMYISELGPWLQNQTKKYNNDFRGTLTDLYDVPKIWENRTKTQGVDIIEEPFFSICAFSAPTWVRDNIKMDDIHSGFFARWLIYMPPSSEKMSPGLPKKKESSLAEEAEKEFKEWLDKALKSIGEQRHFKMSEEVAKIFDNKDPKKFGLHQKIIKLAKSYPNHKILEPFTKRWSPALLKFAMIMQLLIDPDSNSITVDALRFAFYLIIPAIKSTVYLLKNVLGEHPHERGCKELKEMILNFIEKREFAFMTRQQVAQWTQNIDCLKGGIKVIDPLLDTLLERGELIVNKSVKNKNSWEYAPQKVDN